MYTHTHTHTHTYIYIMEFYPAIKNNEVRPFATTWVYLEGIMLSEISQIEKEKYCLISVHMWTLKNATN